MAILKYNNRILTDLDPDAKDFFERAGLNRESNLDVDGLYTAEQARYWVNWLVKFWKSIDVWDPNGFLHVMLGGENEAMTTHNLFSGNHNIDWYGGVSFSKYGPKGDGATGYGDTNFNGFEKFIGEGFMGMNMYDYTKTIYTIAMGASTDNSGLDIFSLQINNNTTIGEAYFSGYGNVDINSYPLKNIYLQAENGKFTIGANNFTKQIPKVGPPSFADRSLYLLTRNDGGPAIKSDATINFSYGITKALTVNQMLQVNNSINIFNRSLNRI